MGTYIGPGVWQIDTLLGGWTRMTAGYLIEGPAPVLVETGSQTSVPALLAALEEHGVAPGRSGRGGRHPHPPRPCRRGGRRGPGLSPGHRVRPREGRPPPGRSGPPGQLGRPGLRRPPGLALRSARPRPRSSGSTCSRTGRPSTSARAAPSPPSIRPGTPSIIWPCTTARAASSLPATPSECACPMPGSCARPPLLPTSTWTRPSPRCASSGPATPAGVALAHYGLMADPLETLEGGGGDPAPLGRGGREGLAGRGGHRRRPRSSVLTASGPRRPRAPDQARDPQRHPLQRRRPAALAGDHPGPSRATDARRFRQKSGRGRTSGRWPAAPTSSAGPRRYWVW